MSDVQTNEKEPEKGSETTLYEEIVQVSGIEYDDSEFDTPEEFKRQVVRWFDKNYPPDDKEAEEKFEADCSDELQNWLADAATVVKENRDAKRKKAIPAIDGFPGEDKAKPPKKAKAKKEKVEKEAKERGPNRYLRAFRLLTKTPDMDTAALAKAGDFAEPAAKYCIEAYKAAETAFKEAGRMK